MVTYQSDFLDLTNANCTTIFETLSCSPVIHQQILKCNKNISLPAWNYCLINQSKTRASLYVQGHQGRFFFFFFFFALKRTKNTSRHQSLHGKELAVLHAIVSFGCTIREPKCKIYFKFIVEAYLIMKCIGVTCHNYIVIAPSLYLGCVFI